MVRTLLVGDEPRDIVFAGNPVRAFITTAHRGQQRTDPSIANVPGAGDPQFTTPGMPRADVWIFDPANLGATMGGTPLKIMSFFTDTPRALAVSPDRNTVYVAGFKTGNQTTTVQQGRVCTGFQPNKPVRFPMARRARQAIPDRLPIHWRARARSRSVREIQQQRWALGRRAEACMGRFGAIQPAG